jgi:hypothetical protein
MSGRLQVPFVPTPEPVVRRMLTVADLKPGELVYDLSAGDGRILSSAVKEFNARAIGVELHESRYEAIAKRIERELKAGARVVSHDFPVHGWVLLYVEKVTEGAHSHMVYMYQVPRSMKHQSASIPRTVSRLTKWSGF